MKFQFTETQLQNLFSGDFRQSLQVTSDRAYALYRFDRDDRLEVRLDGPNMETIAQWFFTKADTFLTDKIRGYLISKNLFSDASGES